MQSENAVIMKGKKYEEIELQKENTLILRLQGKFYNAYNDSAYLLHRTMGYKVNTTPSDKRKAGFPIESLDKVLKVLKTARINVCVINGDKMIVDESFCDNQYLQELSKAKAIIREKQPEKQHNQPETSIQKILSVPKGTEEVVTPKPVSQLHTPGIVHIPQRPLVEKCEIHKEYTLFIQGQGFSMENALIEIQNTINQLIQQGNHIVTFSLVENKTTNRNNLVTVQGILVYQNQNGG